MLKVEDYNMILVLLQRVNLTGAEANGFVQLLGRVVEERNRLVKEKDKTDGND